MFFHMSYVISFQCSDNIWNTFKAWILEITMWYISWTWKNSKSDRNIFTQYSLYNLKAHRNFYDNWQLVYQIPETHNFYYEDILNRPLSTDCDWYLGGWGLTDLTEAWIMNCFISWIGSSCPSHFVHYDGLSTRYSLWLAVVRIWSIIICMSWIFRYVCI